MLLRNFYFYSLILFCFSIKVQANNYFDQVPGSHFTLQKININHTYESGHSKINYSGVCNEDEIADSPFAEQSILFKDGTVSHLFLFDDHSDCYQNISGFNGVVVTSFDFSNQSLTLKIFKFVAFKQFGFQPIQIKNMKNITSLHGSCNATMQGVTFFKSLVVDCDLFTEDEEAVGSISFKQD